MFLKIQNLVIVDLETTGGSFDFHRVTEIGAVKVRERSENAQSNALATDRRRAIGRTLLTASRARPLLNPEVALKEGGAFFLKLSGAPE